MQKKYIDDFRIVRNERLNSDTFILDLQHAGLIPQIHPGQFVEVLVPDSPPTFLRRPLSVHDVDYSQNTLTLFIKTIGKGTLKLSTLTPGMLLNMVYPLGNTFTLLTGKKVLLAGGGCGMAPLLYLAKVLRKNNCDVHILLAAKTAEDIVRAEVYAKYGQTYFTTEDQSKGEKGLIIQHSLFKDLSDFDFVYTCGPERMMQAVGRLAVKAGVGCEVSLENTMACGIGACLCCVVETNDGHKCVCTEGPVFNINHLKWQI